MFHITSSLFGGLAAITAWALVAPSFDPAAQIGAPHTGHESVNRALKSDRLTLPPNHPQSARTVTTVEVIGVHDAAIVYRDRDGNVLFQIDPVSNVTVVSKGFVVPQLTLRDTPQSKPAPMVETPERDLEAAPKLLIGCEPPASPIAEPALARLPGRCLS
jgi:hypothetical protein